MKVVIVGGGIAGLSAAFDLQKGNQFEVTVIEKGNAIGGKIQTARELNYLIEQGPDSVFTSKPWATELMAEIGLEPDLMEPLSRDFSILTKGKLHPVPRALASLIPSAAGALEAVGFLSAANKRRALKEVDVGTGSGDDESIASFFRRRFGRAFSELVAEPLLAGTHAGDPEKLSMAALYPAYLGMEREHGSISRAAEKRQESGGAMRRVGFLTLRKGMASFPRKLSESLTNVRKMTSAEALELRSATDGLRVETTSGTVAAEHLILAVPADVAAKLIAGIAPLAAAGLNSIPFVSTAIVTLAYRRMAFSKPVHGSGFLVPYRESSPVTGCTWSSNKWADRAPADALLLRAFMGRAGQSDVDHIADADLLSQAKESVGTLLGARDSPVFSRIDRWPHAMPQYELGHLDRLAEIECALRDLPIRLIGSSYRGISIPDCVRQGREAARRLRLQFGPGS